jgi:hypothetical protein
MKATRVIPANMLAMALGLSPMAAAAQDRPANNRTAPADANRTAAAVQQPPDSRVVTLENTLVSSVVAPTSPPQNQTARINSPRDVGSGIAPEAPQPDGFITSLPDLPSVATSTPSSTKQNARGKWEVSEYDALHDQSSGNRRAGQIMAGPGDGAAGPLTATSNTTVQSPRDPASGQATARTAAPGNQDPQFKVTFEDILISSAKAPVAGATGPQPGNGTVGPGGSVPQAQYNPKELQVQSPRDPASGQATGYLKIEGIDGESKVTAAPSAGDQFISGSGGDGTGIRKKQPRRDRNGTRGKRMHKP